jgi:hypothetical protein
MIILMTISCNTITGVGGQINEAKETVETIATQAQDLLTESAPLIATVEAFPTENPEMMETAQAFATQALSLDQAPTDIPIITEGDTEEFLGSETIVSYATSWEFQSVLTFYETEMPEYGWLAESDGTLKTEQTAIINYSKQNKAATITISKNPLGETTFVLITIQPR